MKDKYLTPMKMGGKRRGWSQENEKFNQVTSRVGTAITKIWEGVMLPGQRGGPGEPNSKE